MRQAYGWILGNLFDKRHEITFRRGPGGTLVAQLPDGSQMTVPGGQGLLDTDVDALSNAMVSTLQAWSDRVLRVPDHPHVVSNARIMAGSPTLAGTRIDTSVIAALAEPNRTYSRVTVAKIRADYPTLTAAAIEDALAFEGVLKQAS